MNSTVGGNSKDYFGNERGQLQRKEMENLALGVTEQVGIDNPQSNTVAIVKCILKGNSNCFIIYYFALRVLVFK